MSILEAERQKRKEAEALVVGMREEGCAAINALDRIFAQATAVNASGNEKEILLWIADVAADALVLAKRCDHAARVKELGG